MRRLSVKILTMGVALILSTVLLAGCLETDSANLEPDESFDAQISESGSSNALVESTPALTETPVPEEHVIEYGGDGFSMSVTLPEGWSYEAGGIPDTERYDGIALWPDEVTRSDDTGIFVRVDFWDIPFDGLCATGVLIEELTLANGITVVSTSEWWSTQYMRTFYYREKYEGYRVTLAAFGDPIPEFEQYEQQVLEMLETLVLSETSLG